MEEYDKEIVRQAAEKIKNKIANLNRDFEATCWICDKEKIKNWIAIIPENFDEDIGMGIPEGNKRKIAFVPACSEHDLEDKEIIKKISLRFFIKLQELKN